MIRKVILFISKTLNGDFNNRHNTKKFHSM